MSRQFNKTLNLVMTRNYGIIYMKAVLTLSRIGSTIRAFAPEAPLCSGERVLCMSTGATRAVKHHYEHVIHAASVYQRHKWSLQ